MLSLFTMGGNSSCKRGEDKEGKDRMSQEDGSLL